MSEPAPELMDDPQLLPDAGREADEWLERARTVCSEIRDRGPGAELFILTGLVFLSPAAAEHELRRWDEIQALRAQASTATDGATRR